MYGSYNTQQALQHERIRELIADAQPQEANLGRRVLNLLSRLRSGRMAESEPNCSQEVSRLSQNPS